MKILIVNDYSTPTGGTEIYCLKLRSLLREAGHDARLFSSSVGNKNLRQADFECWGTNNKIINRFLQTFNPISSLKLKKVLKKFQPDVVHLNIFLSQLSPLILHVLKKVPVIYTAHWYKMICPKGTKLLPNQEQCSFKAGKACIQAECLPFYLWWIDMIQLWLISLYKNNIDLLLANSKFTTKKFTQEGISTDTSLPYFVERSNILKYPTSERATVCFIGRLVPEKGLKVLIKAMNILLEKLPSARLLVVGDGPEKRSLERFSKDLKLSESIEFLGFVPNEELNDVLFRSHVLAIPSIWAEPFGIVGIEASARGLPVVATRGGGLEEIVENNSNGFLVNPGNAEELADKLYSILTDSELAQRMGKYGHEKAMRKFTKHKHLHDLTAIYESLARVKSNSNKSVVLPES